ncbi:MAG: PstS family phosphate ABC transporter substrate-binding protein [Synechococcaceae cyanobacterium SM2_3_1]|nr:PstS family phosphate ABC transporter substrate-binding protein [Synechococcaceae cyanobacterium SM2_3_1]
MAKHPPPIIYLLILGALGWGTWQLVVFWRNSSDPQPTCNASDRSGCSDPGSSPSQLTNASAPEFFREVTSVPSGVFNYGGSTTWAPIRLEVDSVIQTVWPDFMLRYTDPVAAPPGSGTGIRMLLDNQLSFSQSSRPLKSEEYAEAETRGFALVEIPTAIDGIAVAVHPGLAVEGITVTQLRDIYLGRIRNWQEVGGPDLSITPYSRDPEAGGTVEFFIENVLEGESLSPTVEITQNTTLSLRAVARNPGGIYYASAPEVIPQCTVKGLAIGRNSGEWVSPFQGSYVPPSRCPARRNRLHVTAFRTGDYPITRRLFVIVKDNNQTDEQAGRAYADLLLTDQGQELIEQAGFVAIQ